MRLLILGNAPCLEADLTGVELAGFSCMALNRAGARFLGRIEFWATYHPEVMAVEGWMEQRKERGGNDDYQTVTHCYPAIKIFPRPTVFGGSTVSGSCALFGALYGIHLGFTDITLAGCPLDDEAYHMYRRGWENESQALKGVVHSLSGWTKTFLEALNGR